MQFDFEFQTPKQEIEPCPHPGKILIVVGYHAEEVEWGEKVVQAFENSVLDTMGQVEILRIKNRAVHTGDNSQESNKEIGSKIIELLLEGHSIDMVIDLHEHPQSLTNLYYPGDITIQVPPNQTDKISTMITTSDIQGKVIPIDQSSSIKTAGFFIPTVVLDPDVPKEELGKISLAPQLEAERIYKIFNIVNKTMGIVPKENKVPKPLDITPEEALSNVNIRNVPEEEIEAKILEQLNWRLENAQIFRDTIYELYSALLKLREKNK